MAKQYGITVTSKDGTKEATEWFGSEVERDQFFAWYRDHGRTVVRAERVDERAARRALEKEQQDQRLHELNVALAGASRSFIDNRRYQGGDRYEYGSSGMAAGLALGVAAGLLF